MFSIFSHIRLTQIIYVTWHRYVKLQITCQTEKLASHSGGMDPWALIHIVTNKTDWI